MKSLPGWTSKIEEISNGVFKVTLIDSFGRKAEIIDDATEETIQKALSYAFDIEKQISKKWDKFLYDFCLSQFADTVSVQKMYNENDFGSWSIEVDSKRLLYIGKNSRLVSQTKSDNRWFDNAIIKNEELTYEVALLFLQQMR